MDGKFFEKPRLNFTVAFPGQHWEHDEDGQPTKRILDTRRFFRGIEPIETAFCLAKVRT